MDALESKMLDKYKERIKRQNQRVKENYDKVSVTLPKGTVERIKALGMTINGAINSSLIAYLECLEESANEDAQAAQISQELEQTESIYREHEKAENKPNNEDAIQFQTIEELNAFVLQKQAENEARKSEEVREIESEQPQEESAQGNTEPDGFNSELVKLKARRKQVVEEREKYGELMESGIKELVDSFGEELKTEEYKTRIIDTFGAVNYDRIIDYMDRRKP